MKLPAIPMTMMTHQASAMKSHMAWIVLLAFVLLGATQACADFERHVDMYVEVGESFIFLTRSCSPDGLYRCNCALADENLAPDFKDATLCWREEGDKIIFTNHKFRFEKKLTDVKMKITEPLVASEPRIDTTRQTYPE